MFRNFLTQTISPILFLAIGLVGLIASSADASEPTYWIYFKDKGITSHDQLDQALGKVALELTDRARVRRTKLDKIRLVDEQDLPVSQEYIAHIRSMSGIKVRIASRWLNAISASVSSEALENLHDLTFVKEVKPVAFRHPVRSPPMDDPLPDEPQIPSRDHNYDYGNSLRQNTFMNLPELHDRGYLGEGILIGVCDAGFDNLDHRCFQNLRIEAVWDFVNNDANVANEGDRGNGQHGTRTLSIMAGFDDGHLIGVAPRASYVLAKTENTDWEQQVEEDAWVAGVEWMDSLGVDIISSSLGYMDWYNNDDLDGETAITTIAANRAVEVGIVVVNAMGNTGFNRHPGDKMIAPADGFSVFSIGATNRDSTLSGFSSIGPTFDGRIKPDFVTFGSSVIFAGSGNDTGYAAGAGTSFSAPAVAGLCALLIEADPYLSPLTLRELLQNTSDRVDEPDTLYGWGIPNGLEALDRLQPERVELVIPLHRGWNTISLNLRSAPAVPFPENLSPLVEADILALAKDGHGRFYAPRIPFNNIPFWDRKEGYQLNLDQVDTLWFEGLLSAYSEPIALVQGWQIVAYYPNFDLPVRDAMRSLTDDDALTIIKDEWGRFYFPRLNFSNLTYLSPGRGYHIRLSHDAFLRYPRARIIDGDKIEDQSPTFFFNPTPEEYGMSVLLLASNGVESGDEAAFIDNDGNMLGAGVFIENKCGIALWGAEADGILPDLKIWNKFSNQVLNPNLKLVEGTRSYSPDGLSVFEVSVEIPVAPTLEVTSFPTPFNDRLTISVKHNSSDGVVYALFDLTGKLALKGAIPSELTNATLNASGLPTGLYILKVRSKDSVASLKVICLK